MEYEDQVASIVHDVKNRLQLLLGPVGELSAHADIHVRDIAQRFNRDLDEVNQQLVLMLSLYRLESTDLVSQEEIYLVDVFDSFIDRLNDPRLTVECNPDIIVFSDMRLLNAVIGDAIHNALRYSEGNVKLVGKRCAQGVMISVSDNGGAPIDANSGPGVGLWIAEKIAHSHQRDAECGFARFSAKLESGGVFEMYLP